MMRIGLVAKGLLIKGDMDLELVLMCRDKPTQTLLDTVCHNLPTQIEVRDAHRHIMLLLALCLVFSLILYMFSNDKHADDIDSHLHFSPALNLQ